MYMLVRISNRTERWCMRPRLRYYIGVHTAQSGRLVMAVLEVLVVTLALLMGFWGKMLMEVE